MASQKDVRAIALSLEGVVESQDHFAFAVKTAKGVKPRQFVWAWNERVHPTKPRVPRADVLVVRVSGPDDKAALLAADSEKFFTEPHYDGYPAVLVRLPEVTRGELRALVSEAWRCAAETKKKKKKTAEARRRSPRR
jgi:hypothetical protein